MSNEHDVDTQRLPVLRFPPRERLTNYPDTWDDPAEKFERSPPEPRELDRVRIRVRRDRRRGDSK
jgi:hypothetical protein